MRIFLDANILFSAAKSDGAIRELLLRLKHGAHVLVADTYVVEEARRNIVAKTPASEKYLDEILNRDIDLKGVRTHLVSQDVDLPEKDRPVLAAAIGLRCGVLVTGDSAHFGNLFGVSVEGTVVLSPRMLADLLFPNI